LGYGTRRPGWQWALGPAKRETAAASVLCAAETAAVAVRVRAA